MAQQGIFLNFACQGLLERINIINSFSGVGALPEEILVDVRDGGSVGVHTAGPGEDFLEERPLPIGRQCRSNARLNQRVAIQYAAFAATKCWLIQGMRHGSHQTRGGATRQTSVGIKCDDVANIVDCFGRPACSGHESSRRGTAQQVVQFM